MRLDQLLYLGLFTTAATAVVKIALLNAHAGALVERGFLMLAMTLMALWLLTATLAGLVFVFGRRASDTDCSTKMTPEIANDPGKENLIDLHARDWGLTKAETDVAIMVVKGFANAEIAAMRGSALQTVKSHLSAIYQKSGLDGRYQLIAFITDEVCEASRANRPDSRTDQAKKSQSRRPRIILDLG